MATPTATTTPAPAMPQNFPPQLLSNLPHLLALLRQGKMDQRQTQQLNALVGAVTSNPGNYTPEVVNVVRQFRLVDAAPRMPGVAAQPQTPPQPQASPHALRGSPGPAGQGPSLAEADATSSTAGPSTATNVVNPGPQPWPNQSSSRSTLTAGLAAGRVSGTPTLLSRGNEDLSMFASPDWLNAAKQTRKSSAAEQAAMKRTIQDLVSSIDPNVKIEPEVEELLLDIADEFVDSVANFSCKLAKHRGAEALEVRDLQLHLERNHNIRIPGFASDDTRMAISQSGGALGAGGAGAGNRRTVHMTLRSARLNAVQAAKRDGKLL